MKNKIILSIVGGLLICVFWGFETYNNQPETIMIRSSQVGVSAINGSDIMVYKGDKQIKEIKIDRIRMHDQKDNYDKLMTVVRQYEREGYQVVSHSESMLFEIRYINTIIMTRR